MPRLRRQSRANELRKVKTDRGGRNAQPADNLASGQPIASGLNQHAESGKPVFLGQS